MNYILKTTLISQIDTQIVMLNQLRNLVATIAAEAEGGGATQSMHKKLPTDERVTTDEEDEKIAQMLEEERKRGLGHISDGLEFIKGLTSDIQE